jgi:hypothetical protein
MPCPRFLFVAFSALCFSAMGANAQVPVRTVYAEVQCRNTSQGTINVIGSHPSSGALACQDAKRRCREIYGGNPGRLCSVPATGGCGCCPCVPCVPRCCPSVPCGGQQTYSLQQNSIVSCRKSDGTWLPNGCGPTCDDAKQDCVNRGGIPQSPLCGVIFGDCPSSTFVEQTVVGSSSVIQTQRVCPPSRCCPPKRKRCRLFSRLRNR